MLKRLELSDIRQQISGADDDKIRRIVALMDREPARAVADSILDPLRPRLALLRPPRPLRFVRLLFMPLDKVIVPTPRWRPGDATLPRGALVPIGKMVHQLLAGEATEIDACIAGRDTADEAAITAVGARLWRQAGDILADTSVPSGWDNSGLPPTVFPALACAAAAVLRRAEALRALTREKAAGVTDAAIRDLLVGLEAESAEGFRMFVALLLAHLPDATPMIQRLIASARGSAEGAKLRQAFDQALDGALTALERDSGVDTRIRHTPVRAAAQEAQRVAALLRAIDSEPDAARHRPRVVSIRVKLDQACRTRFGDGLTESLLVPLGTADAPVTASDQTGIECRIRDLRALESTARKIGGAKVYDALLDRAAAAAKLAAESGILTPVRHMRLVEILAGPEAAAALYPLPD